MSDGLLALAWSGAALGALVSCVLARGFGVPSTYVRDALHVGAGLWVLGWPAWRSPLPPLILAGAVAVLITLVRPLAHHHRAIARFEHSVSGGRERFAGIVVYAWSYVVFSALGLLHAPLPAGAALLALALGDGVGGLLGRRFGARGFRLPYGQHKTYLGSATVFLFAAAGIALSALWLGAPLGGARLVAAAGAAALAEAWSPRHSDNFLLPAAVWVCLVATS